MNTQTQQRDTWLESMKAAAFREEQTYQATFTKLRSGDWGARIPRDQIQEGDTPQRCDNLEITKRSGETKTAMIGRVVAEFDDAVLVALY